MEPAQPEQGPSLAWQQPSGAHDSAEAGATKCTDGQPAPSPAPTGREPAELALHATAPDAEAGGKRARSDSQKGQAGSAGTPSSSLLPAKKQRADSSGGTPAADARTGSSSGDDEVAAGGASTSVTEAVSEEDVGALQPPELSARSREEAETGVEDPAGGLVEPPAQPEQDLGREEEGYEDFDEGPAAVGGTVQRSVAAVVECLACDLCHCLLDDPVSSPECMHMCAHMPSVDMHASPPCPAMDGPERALWASLMVFYRLPHMHRT